MASRMYEKIRRDEVYFIAEMSANHGNDLDTALAIVEAAAQAGADCLKVQTYTADTLTLDCDNEYFRIEGGLWDGRRLYGLYANASFPWEWHEPVKRRCDELGIDFLSTPFDETAVDFLDELGVDAFKIASFEIVDTPLIKYAAAKGKTMVVSTGMASLEEVDERHPQYRQRRHRVAQVLQRVSGGPAGPEPCEHPRHEDAVWCRGGVLGSFDRVRSGCSRRSSWSEGHREALLPLSQH